MCYSIHSTLKWCVHLRFQTDYILKFIRIFIFSSLACWDIAAVRQDPKTITIFGVYLLHNCWLMSFMRIKKIRKLKITLSVSFWTANAFKNVFSLWNCSAPHICFSGGFFVVVFAVAIIIQNTSCFSTGKIKLFHVLKVPHNSPRGEQVIITLIFQIKRHRAGWVFLGQTADFTENGNPRALPSSTALFWDCGNRSTLGVLPPVRDDPGQIWEGLLAVSHALSPCPTALLS